MTIRYLLAVAGTAAMLAPSTAFGQPDRDPTRQPDRDRQPSVTSKSTGSILNDRVGSWNVRAEIYDPTWLETRTSPSGTTSSPSKPADQPAGAPPTGSTNPQMLTGIAETHMVLGQNILRERFVLSPDGTYTSSRTTTVPGDAGRTREPDRTTGAGGEHCRGLCFLAFDDRTGQYSLVAMDNKHAGIKYCTGTFDSSANRIVFRSFPDRHDIGSTGARPDNPGRPEDAPKEPGRQDPGAREPERVADAMAMARDHSSVTVVLEILGHDSHRVTMYDAAYGAAPMPAQPAGTPSERERRPDSTPSGEYGRKIYQVTYTRAPETDAARFRERLGDEDRP